MNDTNEYDSVFGISYETENKAKDGDSNKILKESKTVSGKDDIFTEQILNSSPSKNIISTVSKTNLEDKKFEGDDLFTEQILSNYNKSSNTSEKLYDNPIQTNDITFNKSKKNRKKVEEEYSMFDVKEIMGNSIKEEKSLKKIIDKPLFIDEGDYGIQMIKQMIDKCWTYDKKHLAEYMAKRIIFDDDTLIAFDKPYFLAYSGKSKKDNIITMDSCLQELKKLVAPDISRLSIVKSLDKNYSGIILFSKSKDGQERYKEMIENELISFNYRVLVRGIPSSDEGTINFPLVKLVTKKGDVVVKPYKEEKFPKKSNIPIMFGSTDFRIIETNKRACMSYLEVTVKKDNVHQIRTHLTYGLNTPIMGDFKYNPLNNKNIIHPPKLTNEARNLLDISSTNGYKQLPMLCHLYKASFPGKQQLSTQNFAITCHIPTHMKFILKKLKLLKR